MGVMTQGRPERPNKTFSDLVAEEIRSLMGRQRMTGRALAEALGVSPSWVSYRLTGVTDIDVNDLQRIADALGVEAGDLLPPPIAAALHGHNPNHPQPPKPPPKTARVAALATSV